MKRVLLAILSLTFSCTAASPPKGDACRLNSDCEAPLLCEEGLCLPECRQDRDCASDRVCRDQRCEIPLPEEGVCSAIEDCPEAQTCIGGVCAAITLNTLDAGFPSDGGPVSAPDSGVVVGPDGGVSGLPYGAVCTGASQCLSGLCLGPTGAPSGRCTKPCVGNTDCTYPDTCSDVPGAGKLCGSNQVGAPAGAPCPGGNAECASGVCVQPSPTQSFCSQQCAPLPTCPAGLTCAPVPDGQGGASTLCVPGGMGTGFGGVCSAASECATNLCIGVPSTGRGVCTSPCDSIPCPGGYACTGLDNGQGGTIQVCAPVGAAGAGYGESCTGASSCQTGLCLSDPRLGGAFCTKPCSGNADCASIAGLVCVRLPGGAQVCAAP